MKVLGGWNSVYQRIKNVDVEFHCEDETYGMVECKGLYKYM